MRTVGQYKGCEIRITDMYMSETYGGFLALSDRRLEEVNRRLANEDVSKTIEKIWGKDRVLHIANLEKIDYKKRLPDCVVIIQLVCLETIHNGSGHASNLFMAWFQEPDEDPFAKAVSNLKEIKWEEKAKDFYF